MWNCSVGFHASCSWGGRACECSGNEMPGTCSPFMCEWKHVLQGQQQIKGQKGTPSPSTEKGEPSDVPICSLKCLLLSTPPVTQCCGGTGPHLGHFRTDTTVGSAGLLLPRENKEWEEAPWTGLVSLQLFSWINVVGHWEHRFREWKMKTWAWEPWSLASASGWGQEHCDGWMALSYSLLSCL